VKYIYSDSEGNTKFDQYFQYLDKVRDELGDHLYAFAADPNRYYLNSAGTLHDAWLSSLQVEFNALAKPAVTDLEVKLLGPFHDRTFVLHYKNVKHFDFNWAAFPSAVDLLTHELYVEGESRIHEYQFDHGVKVMIECESITWQEVIRS
jgi:hypothetical protein